MTRRTTRTTKAVIEEFKDLIENTKCDLESHLDGIRARLQTACAEGHVVAGVETSELQMMEDEKKSTQKSLEICEEFLLFVDQSRPSLLGDTGDASGPVSRPVEPMALPVAPSLPWLINAEGLSSLQKEATSWRLRLLRHLYGLDRNIPAQQRFQISSDNEQTSDKESIREELSGTEALLEFCKQAEEEANRPRAHLFEDVVAGDNSRQAIVTTLEDLISAKRVKVGNNSDQALGNMSDESIQQFFRRDAHSNDEGSKAGKRPEIVKK